MTDFEEKVFLIQNCIHMQDGYFQWVIDASFPQLFQMLHNILEFVDSVTKWARQNTTILWAYRTHI